MPRTKTQRAGEKLLRRVRKHRLRSVTIFPSLVTLLNGVCGFAAIAAAGSDKKAFALAGYLIVLAMIADMLDGRLARMSHNTSSFGGQLDSLCDVISFGVAPAFIMLRMLEYKLVALAELYPGGAAFLRRFIWLAAAAYIVCAVIRLARFNVENEQDESAHMSFMGLPSPAAAGVVISLIIFHQEALGEFTTKDTLLYSVCENVIVYALPFAALASAVLMVSRIRYPHVLNQYIRGKKPFAHFIKVLLLLGLIIWSRQTALVIMFCGFAATGFAKWLYYRILGPRFAIRRQLRAAELTE
jgi:CDP-diacylglycerol--serine O-phosphatidyltransferase